MNSPLETRLSILLNKIIIVRNELARAIEEAEEHGIIDTISIEKASEAVVKLSEQIYIIEQQLADLEDRRFNPSLSHPVTLDIIEEILVACKNFNFEILKPLGCGDFGCAFITSQGTVIKITKHKKEADAANLILNTSLSHPSLPVIYSIWTWEDCHQYDEPIYVIHREDLSDLEVNAEWFEEVIGGLEYRLQDKFVNKTLTEDDIFDTLLVLMEEYPGIPEDELVAEQIGELYAYLIKRNLWLDDVILDNFGVRDGEPVLRDLGALYIRRD